MVWSDILMGRWEVRGGTFWVGGVRRICFMGGFGGIF